MTIDLDVTPVEPTPRRFGGRRQGWVPAGVAAAVVAAAATAVALGGSPPPPAPPPYLDGALRWVASLIHAPTRGALADDASFTRELASRIEQDAPGILMPISARDDAPRPLRASVLFADDIDSYRIALLSLRNDTIRESRRRYALTYLLWLYGPRGATPETLSETIALGYSSIDAGYQLEPGAPVASALFGDPGDPIWVLLAPPECALATAPATDLTNWTPDAAGYLVRRPRADGPQYWRATCQGILREEGAAPRPAISDHDLDWLMASTEGRPDREWLGHQAHHLTGVYGSELVSLGRVLWSGDVALSPAAAALDIPLVRVRVEDGVVDAADVPVETTVTVLVAPRARGGVIGSVSTVVRTGRDEAWGIDDTVFATPDDPHGLIAVRLGRWHGQVLVLSRSAEVATVRIVDGDGSVLDEAPVDDRPVMLAPTRAAPRHDLHVAALDATGATLTTVELAAVDVRPDHISAWEH